MDICSTEFSTSFVHLAGHSWQSAYLNLSFWGHCEIRCNRNDRCNLKKNSNLKKMCLGCMENRAGLDKFTNICIVFVWFSFKFNRKISQCPQKEIFLLFFEKNFVLKMWENVKVYENPCENSATRCFRIKRVFPKILKQRDALFSGDNSNSRVRCMG